VTKLQEFEETHFFEFLAIRMEESQAGAQDVQIEILATVLASLSIKDRVRASVTCRHFYKASQLLPPCPSIESLVGCYEEVYEPTQRLWIKGETKTRHWKGKWILEAPGRADFKGVRQTFLMYGDYVVQDCIINEAEGKKVVSAHFTPVVIVALLVWLPVPLVVVPLSGTLVVTATTVLVLVLTNVVEAVEAVVVALRPLE